MHQLNSPDFPSKYLTCYEAVLMTLLRYQNVDDEAQLMGTQACFVFESAAAQSDATSLPLFNITPKLRSVDDEWQLRHDIAINAAPVIKRADLHRQLACHLASNHPVCLPVDLFTLPHTLHHNKLHQHHYITLFGYKRGAYYMVCPYYRFAGWVEAAMIHDGFFSPPVAVRGAFLITIDDVTLPSPSAEFIHTIIEENCRAMLNLSTHSCTTQVVGLIGLRQFTQALQAHAADASSVLYNKAAIVNLSRHCKTMGHSRYWLQRLIKIYQPALLSADLSTQFGDVNKAWQAVSIQLAMGAHGENAKKIVQAATALDDIYAQELRLFNSLLGVIPSYEQGSL